MARLMTAVATLQAETDEEVELDFGSDIAEAYDMRQRLMIGLERAAYAEGLLGVLVMGMTIQREMTRQEAFAEDLERQLARD